MIESTADGQVVRRVVSVVVPVFGNQETLAETLSQVLAVRDASFPHLGLELVFVDDGSPDGSWAEMRRLSTSHPGQVTLVKLSRNFGQLSAILAGYQVARGDAVITISADLQDPPALMANMVRDWESGHDVVVAHRSGRHDGGASALFSRVAYGFARRANPRIPKGGFDYLLLSRRAMELIRSFHGRHRFFQGDVLWLGLPTTFIPYERRKRLQGSSGWTIGRKFTYFVDLVLDSSYIPIRLMTLVGVLTAILGVVYAVIIGVAWLWNATPFAGYAAIMITLLLLGGVIMTMLGVVGEYLWRIADDIKARPLYIVEQVDMSVGNDVPARVNGMDNELSDPARPPHEKELANAHDR